MVDHYPTQKRKKTDPGFPILNTPEGKKKNLGIPTLDAALFSGSFITPFQRGRRETRDCIQKAGYLITSPKGKGEALGRVAKNIVRLRELVTIISKQ